jgi:alpha-L-rhamnosidase
MTRTWNASMIAPNDDFEGAARLRGEISLASSHGAVVRAELFASSLGIFEAFLAGKRVSDDVLSPGWSSYEWRLRYRVCDVTELVAPASISPDPVVVGIALGNGWYRGRLGFLGSRSVYGDELAAIVELEVEFADGHVQVAGTDLTWRAGPSPVLANDLYDGQTIDARRRDDSWLQPGAELSGWVDVHAVDFDTERLTSYLGPVVRRQEVLTPTKIWTSPAGCMLVDFGQNLAGWVRLRARGEVGQMITLRHAEVLEDDELGTRPLRTALATDRFILSGHDDEFEPTQTFHGFRYAEIDGYPGTLDASDLEAVVVHSDLRRIGTFECSDPMLNRLHENVVWSQRGNFLDLPTDCPQRDERLGWTGDLAVFAPTAAYLYDVSGFLDDWLADLAAEQLHAGGRVGFVVPDNLKYDPPAADFPKQDATAIWSDAAVWVPWALWQAYGNQEALHRHYPSMAAHVRYVERLLSPSHLWDRGFQFGDWLDPTAPPQSPFEAKADKGVVATASFHRTLDLAARAARLLGQAGDAEAFELLRSKVQEAFVEHYVSEDGIVLSDCPTVYALAIVFGLLDDGGKALAGDRLAQLSETGGFKVATGFAGTPYVLEALSSTGHLDVAYRMLTERGCPSWLYPVTMGATTIWERWDSMLPDGSINPGQMTSFNHYALGAVADWMHRTIGGITPLEPGYRRVLVAAQPGGGITSADSALDTPHGRLSVRWTADAAGELQALDIDVPTGVTALVRRPGHEDREVAAGHHQLTRLEDPRRTQA